MLLPIALLAGLLFQAPQSPPRVPAAAQESAGVVAKSDAPLLDRIAVIGASFSAGTGLVFELEVATSLAVVVDAWRVGKGEPANGLGNFWFFQDADKHGHRAVNQAVEWKPTLVLGIDFLFWYACGDGIQGEERLVRLERGLRELERFECPVYVGDVPDVSFALEGYSSLVKGPLIYPAMLPDTALRERINARIHAWAADHQNVTVLPLADFVERTHAGEPIRFGPVDWPANSFATLIQKDLLHPTLEGAIALLAMTFDTIRRTRDDVPEAALLWDKAAIRTRVLELTESGRELARARAARQAERRAQRKPRGDR